MNEDRLTGAATQIGGKIKDTFGRVTGDTGLQAEGKIDQFSGQVQNAYGAAKDSVRDGVRTAGSQVDQIMHERPLLTLLALAGAGFVLARLLHR